MRQMGKAGLLVVLTSIVVSFPLRAEEGKAFLYLYQTMDKFHNSFDVYTDKDAGGNHFFPTGFLGDTSAITVETNYPENVFSGTSCIKIQFQAGASWAAVYWQEPESNWATVPLAGYNLTGASKLTFQARGQKGGEKVEFFAGGLTGPYPDSLPKTSTGLIVLSRDWNQYSIDLTGKDLSYIIGGFGFYLTGFSNPEGATFYLDDIKYHLERLDQPRFLQSYQPVSVEAPDLFWTNACFIYDNALAVLALLSRGKTEDLKRAGLICDAFLFARENDRFYQDGRLRNAYRSGDLSAHLTGKANLPGWWDPVEKRWCEDEKQISTDTGNLAWVILALTHYYQQNPVPRYLEAAVALGQWLYQHTYSETGGYTAGYLGWEPEPVKLTHKSTEHNIDVYAAFHVLYQITGDSLWEERSQHARSFVESMWNQEGSYFWIGTRQDGVTPDTSKKVLDVQTWAMMALQDYFVSLNWLEENFRLQINGLSGFDFNNDRDGIWWEGTGQMALVYQILQQPEKFLSVINSLRQTQKSAQGGDGPGIVAASCDHLSTGLGWEYFMRVHTATTCWYLFAERAFNPYQAVSVRNPGDLNQDGRVDICDVILCLQMIIGGRQSDLYQADLSQDGNLDILDVILILRKAVGWD